MEGSGAPKILVSQSTGVLGRSSVPENWAQRSTAMVLIVNHNHRWSRKALLRRDRWTQTPEKCRNCHVVSWGKFSEKSEEERQNLKASEMCKQSGGWCGLRRASRGDSKSWRTVRGGA